MERPGQDLGRLLQGAVSTAQRDLGSKLQYVCDGFQHHVREAQEQCGKALQFLGQQSTRFNARSSSPLAQLASVTMSRKQMSPIFDLGFNPLDIKHRLTTIPIFVVAHKDDSEFVLVSGEGSTEEQPRQLGLFFFTQSDAEDMVQKIKEQSPELANQSHVMQLTLDQVYDFAVNPSEQTLPPGNVMFRFMPDAQQVRHALQLYKEAEVKDVAFTGVPVFQAEGLTVKTEKTRYTPLFFSKEDLDAAVGNAYEQREQHRDNVNKSNSARADADLEAAQSKYDSADNDVKDQAREGLEKAKNRNSKYKGRVETPKDPAAPKESPKVEVGCLEEVLQKMLQAEGKGDWGSVMFVPPGSISKQKP